MVAVNEDDIGKRPPDGSISNRPDIKQCLLLRVKSVNITELSFHRLNHQTT